jgi:hypothetical protein
MSIEHIVDSNNSAFIGNGTPNNSVEEEYTDESDEEIVHDTIDVRIVGVERTCSQGDISWWYLMRPVDLTISVGRGPEPDYFGRAYGNVEEAMKLDNGEFYIRFSPKWGRSSEIPENWKFSMWRTIWQRFWNVPSSSSADSIRWDGILCQYFNLSQDWSVHLCGDLECKQCCGKWRMVEEDFARIVS